MEVGLPRESAGQLSSPETAELVFDFMRRNAIDNRFVGGMRRIAIELGIGRNTVHTAVRRLQRDARLVVRRIGTGDGYASVYDLSEGESATGLSALAGLVQALDRIAARVEAEAAISDRTGQCESLCAISGELRGLALHWRTLIRSGVTVGGAR